MKLADAETGELCLLRARSGSHAFGLATETSDEDFKGVFYLPRGQLYGLHYIPQVSDERNDRVFFELGRFVELLLTSNPGALELLATPEDCILYRHPLMDHLSLSDFLSKACVATFAGYAEGQIRRARGLKKKVYNPVDKLRKEVPEFCWVVENGRTSPLLEWQARRGFPAGSLALAALNHTHDLYGLYHDPSQTWSRGVSTGPAANDVHTCTIPKDVFPVAYLSFNRNGYSAYCKRYRDYWDWVEKRNEERYLSTLDHGKGYDSKNMMHTLRLLDTAIDIFELGTLRIKRPDREFLLEVKRGAYEIEAVLEMVEQRLTRLHTLAESSALPDSPNTERAEQCLVAMRTELYS